MAILVHSQTFKGRLIDLLGQTRAEALTGNPQPMGGEWVEGPEASRCYWPDVATDEDTGQNFQILYIVRFRENRVWAVGIKANNYLFVINTDDPTKPYFEACPKPEQYNADMVNWVTQENGTFRNYGVSI